ncbi:TPA: DUF1471 domain-containing protein, partial [Klebsiella variicola]|nr:DUF1471 domain-containing protein [Klebsiella variicola]
ISVSGGTIDELTSKLAAKAEKSGADYFRITYLKALLQIVGGDKLIIPFC